MLPQQEALLINGGDCPLHYHSIDRVVNHDTLNALESITNQRVITAAFYTATEDDDIIICTNTCTVTLPIAKNGKRFTVIKTFAGSSVIINCAGADTINGAATDTIITQWDTRTLNALIIGGWIIL